MIDGKKVAHNRNAAGLTQEELAQQSGISLRTIKNIERGLVLDCFISTVEALAGALGVTVNDLLKNDADGKGGQGSGQEPVVRKAVRDRRRSKEFDGLIADGYHNADPVEQLKVRAALHLPEPPEAESSEDTPADETKRAEPPEEREERH